MVNSITKLQLLELYVTHSQYSLMFETHTDCDWVCHVYVFLILFFYCFFKKKANWISVTYVCSLCGLKLTNWFINWFLRLLCLTLSATIILSITRALFSSSLIYILKISVPVPGFRKNVKGFSEIFNYFLIFKLWYRIAISWSTFPR